MPAAAARTVSRERPFDMVLGDRYGAACAAPLARRIERELQGMGYRVGRNMPYAGGYTTEHYGRPAQGIHALQIEINRGLYLDEARLEPTAGFTRLQGHMAQLTGLLAESDWSSLTA
jgi:N-formylglutamate amidohydrolase